MTIIAIDPGKSGGIAASGVITKSEPDFITHGKMPDTINGIAERIEELDDGEAVAYLELVGGFTKKGGGQPGSSMFKFGESFGAIQGILAAYKIRTVLVRPQKWQAFYSLGTRSACASDSQWKNKLKAEAKRRFPKLNVTLATADALLLLDYAMRQERNQRSETSTEGTK